MHDPLRARPGSSGSWDRARRAYVALLGGDDPAAVLLAAGALDLRLGYEPGEWDPSRCIVVSGPDDLAQLRAVVEEAVGVGAWPLVDPADGEPIGTHLGPGRSGAMLGLLMAMEGLVESRSPWGRWRTVVDTIAARVATIDEVTVDLRVVQPRHDAPRSFPLPGRAD
ncbi:MAG: hypothetical protein R2707_04770 [Acidimicrobiales bacterium]